MTNPVCLPQSNPSAVAGGARGTKGVIYDERFVTPKRVSNVVLVGVPIAGTLYAPWHFAVAPPSLFEIAIFFVFYTLTGIGIGVGFHRGFTHRSFVPRRSVKLGLLFLGSLAFQGPVIRWVADHRRHHQAADQAWDTHSPSVIEDRRPRSRLHGLWHAHFGWLFDRTSTDYSVYAPDLLEDRDCCFFQRWYWLMTALSLLLPFALGFLAGGLQIAGGSMLLAGCVRAALLHQFIWAVNSLGHSFGRQDATTRDGSRNSLVLAMATFGEGWHNNHHAAPRCAYNKQKWYQFDFNGMLIIIMGRLGLVTNIAWCRKPREKLQ